MVAHWVKSLFSRRGLVRVALALVVAVALAGGSLYALTNIWPNLGAQGIEILRHLIGNEAVATIENFVFEVQDQVQQWAYQLGGDQPEAPWTAATPGLIQSQPTPPTPRPTLRPTSTIAAGPAVTARPAATMDVATPIPATLLPPATAAPPVWKPALAKTLGTLAGEGEWSPYIAETTTGRVVAYRTFIQPDTARPYALVSVVAMDLDALRLHLVLGAEEPQSSVSLKRPGTIPEADLQPGVIAAAFNGGFKAEHGKFGVKVRGIIVLPPRPQMGTVVMYSDGRVKIGEWGVDFRDSPDIPAWRQNGPLIVQAGAVNPHTADNAPQDWGYTVHGETATWRSALGLSADERTLYYAVGSSLTLPALAQAMAAAGAAQAIQLDINNYWVHFDAFTAEAGQLRPEPLLDTMRKQADNRYLKANARDFFYLTFAR